MAKTLTEMVKDLRGLLDEKDRLDAEAKKNKAEIEAKKQEIAQQMIDEDTPRISCGGYISRPKPPITRLRTIPWRRRASTTWTPSGRKVSATLSRKP